MKEADLRKKEIDDLIRVHLDQTKDESIVIGDGKFARGKIGPGGGAHIWKSPLAITKRRRGF